MNLQTPTGADSTNGNLENGTSEYAWIKPKSKKWRDYPIIDYNSQYNFLRLILEEYSGKIGKIKDYITPKLLRAYGLSTSHRSYYVSASTATGLLEGYGDERGLTPLAYALLEAETAGDTLKIQECKLKALKNVELFYKILKEYEDSKGLPSETKEFKDFLKRNAQAHNIRESDVMIIKEVYKSFIALPKMAKAPLELNNDIEAQLGAKLTDLSMGIEESMNDVFKTAHKSPINKEQLIKSLEIALKEVEYSKRLHEEDKERLKGKISFFLLFLKENGSSFTKASYDLYVDVLSIKEK